MVLTAKSGRGWGQIRHIGQDSYHERHELEVKTSNKPFGNNERRFLWKQIIQHLFETRVLPLELNCVKNMQNISAGMSSRMILPLLQYFVEFCAGQMP